MTDYAKKLEALLLYEGGTLSKKALCDALHCSQADLVQAAHLLMDALKDRGVRLVESSSDFSLQCAPECVPFLKEYDTGHMSEQIGAAAIEVLSVLAYRGASTQADIDSIRGVNSAISLRTLRMRGLVNKEEKTNAETGSQYVYTLTAEALAHLGCVTEEDIPNRSAVRARLASFEERVAVQEK